MAKYFVVLLLASSLFAQRQNEKPPVDVFKGGIALSEEEAQKIATLIVGPDVVGKPTWMYSFESGLRMQDVVARVQSARGKVSDFRVVARGYVGPAVFFVNFSYKGKKYKIYNSVRFGAEYRRGYDETIILTELSPG